MRIRDFLQSFYDRFGTALCICLALLGPARRSECQQVSPANQTIYVIKLHGSVGKIPDAPATLKAITAEQLKRELESPAATAATAIVLDIDGPGGLVSEMQEIAEVLFKSQSLDQKRIVALPRDAFSAWSLICLACKEIVATPTTRMGAAVTVQRTLSGYVEAPEGKDAVAQKLAAPWKARMRSICRLTNRCECIPDAMCDQGKQLWWSPTKGLSAQRGPEPDWKCLDDQVGVCCLTGEELVETKVAIGMVRSIQELPGLVGLPGAVVKESSNTQLAVAQKPTPSANTSSDLRKAAAKIREARDLLGIETLFHTQKRRFSTTERVSDSSISGGVRERPAVGTRPETAIEMSERIQGTLRKVKGKLPSDTAVASDANFANDLTEIRTLLDEALQHLRNQAISAAKDRASLADRIMDSIANSY